MAEPKNMMVEIKDKDRRALINELINAELIDKGKVLVLMEYKDVGVSGYLGYENFRVFCDELVRKYLNKKFKGEKKC